MVSTKSGATALQHAFEDFITGRGANRTQLELKLDGIDITEQFVQALERLGYQPTPVGKLALEPGQRIPAFFIRDVMAYFGWVFWEKFTDTKMRKLWGSTLRNQKGDWAIQLPPTKPTLIYANPRLKILMDIDHPW